jgi:hypothetical protein
MGLLEFQESDLGLPPLSDSSLPAALGSWSMVRQSSHVGKMGGVIGTKFSSVVWDIPYPLRPNSLSVKWVWRCCVQSTFLE